MMKHEKEELSRQFDQAFPEAYWDEIDEILHQKMIRLRQLKILAENNPHLYQEDIEHVKTEIMINGGYV